MSNRKHSKRTYIPGGSYHVTLHSASMTKAFATTQNKVEYISRLANYLSPREARDSSRHKYPKLREEVTALTFCLLDDHLHLPVIDLSGSGMTKLMHRVNTGFSAYFNRAHGRRGPLFDAPFAAKPVADRDHARAVIAYTHLDHVAEQLDYEFCGHRALMGEVTIDWIDTDSTLKIFGGIDGYIRYMDRNGPAILRRKLEEKGMNPHRFRYRPIGGRNNRRSRAE